MFLRIQEVVNTSSSHSALLLTHVYSIRTAHTGVEIPRDEKAKVVQMRTLPSVRRAEL